MATIPDFVIPNAQRSGTSAKPPCAAPCQRPWDERVKMTAGLQANNQSNKPMIIKHNLLSLVRERI